MNTKFAALVLLLLFAWAFVETGQLADLAKRFKRPPVKPPTRQIEILSESQEYRLVKHPLGETQVPLHPTRIVSLSNSATDSLCALEVKPILATTSLRLDSITPHLAEQLKDVPRLRYGEAVDLEAVLAAKPDLILAGTSRDGRLYNQLSKVAPTVCIASGTMADREMRLMDVGETLGMAQQARERLELFEQRVQEARETLAQATQGKPVSFLRFRRNTCVIYTRTTMFGPLLFEQLGLPPDPAMPMVMTGGGWDVLSVERLSQLQSEYLFMVVDSDSEIYLDRVSATPIWKNIPAVQHGHTYRVASGTWLSGDGVLGCEAIIDDVQQAIVVEESNDASQ